LTEVDLDSKDLIIIKNLYWNQKACVRLEQDKTAYIDIKRGVRQGCVLSPILFNVYAEYIIKRSLQNREEGININGTIINNIRYADDTVILAESGEQLQILMEILNKESEEMGLTINKRKTKTMVFSKTVNPVQLNIMAGNERIENINRYIYLDREMNSALDHSKEIR